MGRRAGLWESVKPSIMASRRQEFSQANQRLGNPWPIKQADNDVVDRNMMVVDRKIMVCNRVLIGKVIDWK